MKISDLFSKADLDRIERATAEAERLTSGEIVPYIVERIDDHGEARWCGATLGALFAALIAGVLHLIGGFWGGAGVLWITLPTLVGAGAGYLVAGREAVSRWLVPADTLDRLTRARAAEAFLDEEIFTTRDRTGILIFLALAEHRAAVVADEGINREVPQALWDGIVVDLVAGMKAGEAAEALQHAVVRCGEILAEHHLPPRPDDTDELHGRPRIRGR
jgi:putative membrane protein